MAPPSATHPIRPPAVPLAVRGPYVSTWLPGTTLPGTWPTFWNGRRTQLAGIVRVDGVPYVFAGAPAGSGRVLRQTLLETTPTRSRFHLEGGGIRLIVEFLSPVEPGDLRAQSIPLSYVLLTVASARRPARINVQMYLDISGEWAGGSDADLIRWAPVAGLGPGGDLQAWTVQPSRPQPLSEQDQLAGWGTVIWATPRAAGLRFQSGPRLSAVRRRFVRPGPADERQRCEITGPSASDRPVFAFAADLGRVSAAPVTVPLFIGQRPHPCGQLPRPRPGASVDRALSTPGRKCSVSLALTSPRPAARADTAGRPDHGRCHRRRRKGLRGTVRARPCGRHTAAPNWWSARTASPGRSSRRSRATATSPPSTSSIRPLRPGCTPTRPTSATCWSRCSSYAEGRRLAEPLRRCMTSARRTRTRPATTDGIEENMPVEESGNMLIMAAAYLKRQPARRRPDFASAPITGILKQWADYLVSGAAGPRLPEPDGRLRRAHCPQRQPGPQGNHRRRGHGPDRRRGRQSRRPRPLHRGGPPVHLLLGWHMPRTPPGRHLDLAYDRDYGGDGTWGTLYNGYADRLLGTGLIPSPHRGRAGCLVLP